MNTTRCLLIPILAIVFLANACAVVEGAGKKKKARLQGYDMLALPGESISLRAKAEKSSRVRFRPDLDDQMIEFLVGEKTLGTAETNDDGVAALTHKFAKAGRYTVAVRFGAKSKYAAEDTFIVDVCDAQTRFLVCDIDHTIADISATKFVFKKNKKVPALPGSPAALTRLAKHYKIIYITARDDAFLKKTLDWLALRKFPRAPIFFWDFGGKKFSHKKYKTREIAAIKKRFPNIIAGVGDKVGDAKAYIANGIKAVIIGLKRDDDLPENAIWAKTWADVEKHLTPKGSKTGDR
jgi:hypothetical protein